MKTRIIYIALFISILSIMSGCSFWNENHSTEERTEDSSKLGSVLSNYSFAQLNGQIAYLTIQANEIRFKAEQEIEEKVVKLPANRDCLEITAGKDYFYVYCTNEDETNGFLRVYDNQAQLINEVELPFKRVSVSNGYIFGYYNDIDDFFGWNSNVSNSHIEATHYINESKFLEKYSNKLTDWNEIKANGKEVVIGNIQFYFYSADYFHSQNYYSNKKPLDVLEDIDYLRYCDGKLASEEYDTKIKLRINQIYNMMRKKEKNFLIYSFEEKGTIYGICNVYKEHGDLLSLLTKDLKYSFSFQYNEKEDKLYKKTEYNDIELIYEDDNHCLYHKLDGVYCKTLSTGDCKKVYDYNGEIGITLLNGWVKFQEIVVHYDDNLVDKQEIKKIW